MNVAVIFAGGSGARMHTRARPKQFLELHGKPVIVYTLELFEHHPDIDAIIVSCVGEWIDYLQSLLLKYDLKKVVSVVEGGATGQESIYKGLAEAGARYQPDSVVLIHDGVRPLIDSDIISRNIVSVREHGSAITTVPARETFVVKGRDGKLTIPERGNSFIAKAPQSFVLSEILAVHEKARKEGRNDFIDSCTLMSAYGKQLALIDGNDENIKITTPMDFFVFRAIVDVQENSQIFGF